MHYMHDLKDLLCAELEDYAEKGKKSGKMSIGDLDSIHKLTDTVKNILKIDMLEDETGYSEDGAYMGEGRIYGTSYDEGMRRGAGYSYARGRGRYAKRDSMGRYSSDDRLSYDNYSEERMDRRYSRDDAKDHLMSKIGEAMENADPNEREILKKCMRELERA